jgi:hypothetical protein
VRGIRDDGWRADQELDEVCCFTDELVMRRPVRVEEEARP